MKFDRKFFQIIKNHFNRWELTTHPGRFFRLILNMGKWGCNILIMMK